MNKLIMKDERKMSDVEKLARCMVLNGLSGGRDFEELCELGFDGMLGSLTWQVEAMKNKIRKRVKEVPKG